MVTTQHTVAVTALSSNTWQPAELVRPAQTESLVSSLSTMLSAANTSPVLDRSIPSQQARRKRRRKRRKNRNALDLLGGHGAPFRDNNQSDYSLTSSTPASSDTEDRRSRPGTPTAINSSSLMSPILSPIMSPAMEPIRVDELEGMEALGLGHGFMNSTTGTGNGLVSTSTPTTSSTHREAYRRRKEVSMNYSRVSEANTGRPCSPLRLAHLLERVNSAEKVIGEGSETNEEACNRSTGSERILSVLHPLSRELSADSQLAEEAASPVVPTTTMEPINITKALLTLSLNDTADALATATAVPPPDSAISLCMAQANTNDTDDGVKTDRSINVDDIDEGDTSLLALHDNDIDSSSCDGDDDDDGEEEYDPEENEQSLCCYEEDPTEYDDNSIIEAELDDDVPELPSLMGTVHSSTSRTNTIGAILKAVKQHSYTNEWPMDEEERKRLEEEGLLEDLHEHHHDSNTKDDADIDDCRLVPRRSDSDTHKEDNVTASSSEENIPVDTAIPSSNEDPERSEELELKEEQQQQEEEQEQEQAVEPDAVLSSTSIRQLDEDMSSDDADSTCAPSRGFAQVRAHYLARQNLMLERELGHARNTAHALREIVRFQEDRLRETDLLNRNLRERIRTLELSISRELADIQQKRHFGLSNYSRKRLMQSGGHSRRGSDTSTSDTLPRRQREDKPLTLSSFRLKDDREDEDIVKQSPPKPRPSVSLWQVASPEPPATLDDNVLNSPTLVSPNISLIEQDAQNIARAMSPTTTNTATSIDSALELDATSTMTYDNITRIESSSNTTKIAVPTTNEQSQSTSPSAIRRDLSSIWCDLRAERSIAIPTEDEGYNSGHSKEGVPLMSNLNAMTSTADTMDNTMTSTELSTASASSSIPLADSLS